MPEPKKVCLNCKICLELDPYSTVNDQLVTADRVVKDIKNLMSKSKDAKVLSVKGEIEREYEKKE